MADPRADAVAALDPSLEEGFYEAGFIDAYLNIRGVKDEAEARSMFAADWARFIERHRAALLAVLLDPDEVMAAPTDDRGAAALAERLLDRSDGPLGASGAGYIWKQTQPAFTQQEVAPYLAAAILGERGRFTADDTHAALESEG